MATLDECEAALAGLAQRLGSLDEELRRRHAPDRTVSCVVVDLDMVFTGRLHEGVLVDIAATPKAHRADHDSPRADVRLAVSSDDLLALTAGELPLSTAWASGRLKVDASVRDLLRVRTWL